MAHEFRTRLRDTLRAYQAPDYRTLEFADTPARAEIPPLVLPLEVAPQEDSESDSVKMLRALLAERERDLKQIENARDNRLRQADEAEKRAADLRARAAIDEKHMLVARQAIETVGADIDRLNGTMAPPMPAGRVTSERV